MRTTRNDAPMPLICPTCQIASMRCRGARQRQLVRRTELRLRQIKDGVEGQAFMVRVLLQLRKGTANHDRCKQDFSPPRVDRCGRRRGSCDRRSPYRHDDAGSCGEGAAEGRQVPGHAEGRAGVRKLCAVRAAVVLQDRRWNHLPSGLVHGLCEEAELARPRAPTAYIQDSQIMEAL